MFFGACTSVPNIYPQFGLLLFILWVPILLLSHNTPRSIIWKVGLAFGLCYQITATYWVIDFFSNLRTLHILSACLIASSFWLFASLKFVIAFWVYGWIKERLPCYSLLTLPPIIVLVFAHFPSIFPLHLSLGLIDFPILLQANEFTGSNGSDLFVLYANVFFYLILTTRKKPGSNIPLFITGLLLLSWISICIIQQNKWLEKGTSQTMTAGLIQKNDPPIAKIPTHVEGYSWSYPPEMEVSRELVHQKLDLLIWPESRFQGYYENKFVRLSYQVQVNNMDTPLLFHDTNTVFGEANFSALTLLRPQTVPIEYRKQVLIPFAEYLPDFISGDILSSIMSQFLGDFATSLEPGNTASIFELDGVNLYPFICYEIIFSDIVAERMRDGHKRLIIVSSNDTWFGNSHAVNLHHAHAILRAVENRTSLIHLTNNGPSITVSPNGKITNKTPAQTRGGFIAQVPISPKTNLSFYSRHPSVFTYILATVLIFWLFMSRKIKTAPELCTNDERNIT